MTTRTVVTVTGENLRGPARFVGEVTLDGTKVVTRYAKYEGDRLVEDYARSGQRYATADEARQVFDKIVRDRLATYDTRRRDERVVAGPEAPLAPAARSPALEAEVRAGVPGAASVLADWLQTQGDVRGELAALHLTGNTAGAEACFAANVRALFGDLDVALVAELRQLDWSRGFLTGAALRRSDFDSRTDLARLTRDFLALPVAQFVTDLRFGLASFESDNDWTGTLAAVVAAAQAPHVRSLRFDDYTGEDSEISWTAYGDFAGAWAQLPALETLVIRSGEGGTLGALDHARLRHFARISGGLGADELAEIFAARLPALEHLELWFGSAQYGAAVTVDMLGDLLAGTSGLTPPSLVHLGLANAEITHELIEPLARSPLVARLARLDLSGGVLQDADVDTLLRHAGAFRHLELLDLSDNLLDERDGEILAALPNARVGRQRDDLGEGERYVAVGE